MFYLGFGQNYRATRFIDRLKSTAQARAPFLRVPVERADCVPSLAQRPPETAWGGQLPFESLACVTR